jgi:acyl carrier protein phosphodiesterase
MGCRAPYPDISAGVDLIANITLLADQDYNTQLALVRSIAEFYPHPDGRVEGVGLDLLADHLVVTMTDYLL